MSRRKHNKKSKGQTSSSSYTYDYHHQYDDDDDDQWDLTKCPRRFHGTSDKNVHGFIEDLELFIAIKGIPLESAFLQLGLMLKGDAEDWWWTLTRDSVETWEQAKARLISWFGYRQTSLVLLFSDLRNRRQKPNERAIHYIISISSIMRNFKPPLPDPVQVGFIISGLKPSIAQHMIGKEELGLLQLTNEIIKVEEAVNRLSKKK